MNILFLSLLQVFLLFQPRPNFLEIILKLNFLKSLSKNNTTKHIRKYQVLFEGSINFLRLTFMHLSKYSTSVQYVSIFMCKVPSPSTPERTLEAINRNELWNPGNWTASSARFHPLISGVLILMGAFNSLTKTRWAIWKTDSVLSVLLYPNEFRFFSELFVSLYLEF